MPASASAVRAPPPMPPADERIHAVLLQKTSQCTVTAAVCGRDLCIFNFAVLNLIDLKCFGMAEMLENQSVLIRYRDFHVHASFQIKHPIFCYVQNMLRLRLCRVSAFVIFRTGLHPPCCGVQGNCSAENAMRESWLLSSLSAARLTV